MMAVTNLVDCSKN